jgi:chondroitin AC lyase
MHLSKTSHTTLYGFLLALLFPLTAFAFNDEIEILRQRLVEDALVEKGFLDRTQRYHDSDFDQTAAYLENLGADGSWADVDYQDRDNSWDPLRALNRILIMSYAYRNPESSLHQDPSLLTGINQALDYWYTVKPECKNWYKNRIAKQFYFNVIALLMQGHAQKDLVNNMISDLTAAPAMTGSNRTLLAISVLYRGVLERNPERIADGVAGVMQQVQITTEEGVQPDYSFHQHGAFLYNGGYGSNFLRETIWLASIVEGTQFAFTDHHLQILRNYYLQGTRWMVYRKVLDYNVRGRRVGRAGGFVPGAQKIVPQLVNFQQADPAHAEQYQTSLNRILDAQPQAVQGNRHFWRSDYTVHYQEDYFTSLKMCSERTVGMEMDVNTENLYGYYLPFGLTYIYRRGDEYLNIFPVWDWARLPGVTSPHYAFSSKGRSSQSTSFVGGVSDGTYGVSSMELDVKQTRARKSWFWFGNEWVALGAGIQSDNEHPIVTGINQTLLKGRVVVDGESHAPGESTLENPGWVWHDSVAYLFPKPDQVQLKAEEQQGNLQKIFGLGADTVYRSEVFSLWFEHGKQPENDSYLYAVVPGCSAEDMAAYAKKPPFVVLSNTTDVQAVSHQELEVVGIAFHQRGNFALNEEVSVDVNRPCLLLVNQAQRTITVSDPTAKGKKLKIEVKHRSGEKETSLVELPRAELAGSSVVIEDKFDLLGKSVN